MVYQILKGKKIDPKTQLSFLPAFQFFMALKEMKLRGN